jgi:hypothetical protein
MSTHTEHRPPAIQDIEADRLLDFRPVPIGTPHTIANRSGEPLVFVNTHRPALHFEEMVREMHALVSAGKLALPPRRPRTAIYGTMLFTKYGDEQRVTKPPQAVFAALTRIGRAPQPGF